MKNILLVGAGNLGSRHLQGIAKLKQSVNVVVVEPNSKARDIARKRWLEVSSSGLHSLTFADLNSLRSGFDMALVATLSMHRLSIIKQLLELNIPHILCEKVAFQSVSLYQQALDMLASSHSQIYLNYIYRLSDVIQDIKKTLVNGPVHMNVMAGNVELGCNLIHYLDLVTYLNDDTDITKLVLDSVGISNSNRRHPALKSFYGIATAEYANGARVYASLLDNPVSDCTLEIFDNHHSFSINETRGQVFVNNQFTADFVAPRVSDTTTAVIQGLEQRRCLLPTLLASFTTNKLMLNSLNKHVYNSDEASMLCPIT